MARVESVTKEILEVLAEHLKDQVPDFRQIIKEFPESNRSLKYPAASIDFVDGGHEPLMPYELSRKTESNNKSVVSYVVGQNNFRLNVDLWERTKEELYDLFEKFYVGFNDLQGTSTGLPGLSLPMPNYHGVICSYEMVRYNFEQNEVGSQRKEWRATIELIGNCKSVLTKEEFIITQEPELTLDAGENVKG